MNIRLLNEPTLDFVDSGIGMCWDKGAYGVDTQKGKERMERVCTKFKHKSMLRFCAYMFEVTEGDIETYELFKDFKYAYVEGSPATYRVKISLQGLLEIGLSGDTLSKIVLEPHRFLVGIGE